MCYAIKRICMRLILQKRSWQVFIRCFWRPRKCKPSVSSGNSAYCKILLWFKIVSSRFQSQSGQPYSHLTATYMLRIPWDSPLVWHLPTSWWPAWQLSHSLPHTCEQALVGLETGICRVLPLWGRHSTNWAMPARLGMWSSFNHPNSSPFRNRFLLFYSVY